MEKSEEIIAEESQKRKQLESQLVDYDKLKKDLITVTEIKKSARKRKERIRKSKKKFRR